jgi:hypothetical protein
MKHLIPYNLFEFSKYTDEDYKNLVRNFLYFMYERNQQKKLEEVHDKLEQKYELDSFKETQLNMDSFEKFFNFDKSVPMTLDNIEGYGPYAQIIFVMSTDNKRSEDTWIANIRLVFLEDKIVLDLRKNTEKNSIFNNKNYYLYNLHNPNKFFDEIIKQINLFL